MVSDLSYYKLYHSQQSYNPTQGYRQNHCIRSLNHYYIPILNTPQFLSKTQSNNHIKVYRYGKDGYAFRNELDRVKRETLREIPKDRPKCYSLCGSQIDDEEKCPK